MAQKLKNLRVKKVDFVDEGANPRADIKLFKRKEETGEEMSPAAGENLLKRLARFLKGEGITAEEIMKEATSFNEQINIVNTERIRDEIWSVCYALQCSMNSILCDTDMDSSGRQTAMNESVDQFGEMVKNYIQSWSSGGLANIQKNFEAADEADLQMAAVMQSNLDELIKKANGAKGELEEMLKINKSKMTPEEREAYEELIKKYAVDSEEKPVVKKTDPKPEGDEDEIEDKETQKGCGGKVTTKKSGSLDGGEGDIYKELHPAVKAEIESLKKFREDAETRELTEVAKKYEIIGKKPEELVPMLKSLRAAGGTAYDDMIGILDATLNTVEQSGVFKEIGKSREGTGDTTRDEAFAKARAKASEIKKARPGLTDAQAMDEALLENPELLAELDK